MEEEIYFFEQTGLEKKMIVLQMCGITYPDKNYAIRRPHSGVFCIEYIEQGTGVVRSDDVVFYPGAGDSYFLHQGGAHFYHSDSDDPWKKYFINISGRLARHLCEGYGLSDSFYFRGLDLKAELLEIIEIAKTTPDGHTGDVILILNRIMQKMREHELMGQAPSSIVSQMKDFLNRRVTETFRMEELCRYIGRSESQTIRIFKAEYGMTPYAYFLSKKLELASRLLDDTSMSVGQIADKLSFGDAFYFSNLFKAKMGMTPSKWRKRQ